VRLETDEGRVLIPNSQALAAAVLLVPERTAESQPSTPASVLYPAACASSLAPASGRRITAWRPAPSLGAGRQHGCSAAKR
jgi:hypothetical protein